MGRWGTCREGHGKEGRGRVAVPPTHTRQNSTSHHQGMVGRDTRVGGQGAR